MLKVGLTGSIAVGKSFVLGVLAELGCSVMDADAAAREAVAAKTAGLKAVAEEFGNEVLNPDGTLNRTKLGEIVFADEAKREKLNSILHPLIMQRQDEQLVSWEGKAKTKIAVVDAALMIESGGYRRFDKLIVVHCQPEIQMQRLMARENISPEAAKQRIAAQLS